MAWHTRSGIGSGQTMRSAAGGGGSQKLTLAKSASDMDLQLRKSASVSKLPEVCFSPRGGDGSTEANAAPDEWRNTFDRPSMAELSLSGTPTPRGHPAESSRRAAEQPRHASVGCESAIKPVA